MRNVVRNFFINNVGKLSADDAIIVAARMAFTLLRQLAIDDHSWRQAPLLALALVVRQIAWLSQARASAYRHLIG